MNRIDIHFRMVALLGVLLGALILAQCDSSKTNSYRFIPSGLSAYLPKDKNVPFSTYIEENVYRIRSVLETRFYQDNPFQGNFTLDEVVEHRRPEEHLPSPSCTSEEGGYRTGYLLIHGVSDSPYSLKEVRQDLEDAYPCAVYRSLLLTGHGTIPGDGVDANYVDWINLVEYGLHQFLGEVDRLFLVGYSTGFTLSLQRVQKRGTLYEFRDERFMIAGLIALSPALRTTPLAILTPYLKYAISYLNVFYDQNPVKYETLHLNLAAQFYRLSQTIDLDSELSTPVFWAVSSDDQTVDPLINYDYFCGKITSPQKKMLWYQGLENIFSACDGMEVIPSRNEDYDMMNHSHVSLPFSVDNPIYGYREKYFNCNSYFSENIKFEECKKKNTPAIYGEENSAFDQKLRQDKFFRRATFNPQYDEMLEKLIDFIDSIEIEPSS